MNTTLAVALIAGCAALGGAGLTVLGNLVAAHINRSTQQAQFEENQRVAGQQDERTLRDRASDRLREAYAPLMNTIANARAGYQDFQAVYNPLGGIAEREKLPIEQVNTLLKQIVQTEALVGLEPTAGKPSAREVQKRLTEFRNRFATTGMAPEEALYALNELEDLVREHLTQFQQPIPSQ